MILVPCTLFTQFYLLLHMKATDPVCLCETASTDCTAPAELTFVLCHIVPSGDRSQQGLTMLGTSHLGCACPEPITGHQWQ